MSTTQWTVASRPRNLDEYFGQTAATAFVRGMTKGNAVPACVGIFGPSGTGKTTLGLIIASLLSGWKGDPLKNPDLVDIPANIDRGIDDIRRAVERSRYSPQGGKRRVMLVDEVHALVGPAASALLKATENPAPRATWILCTDQPYKLNKAMMRRVQPITLGYLSEADCTKAMAHVLNTRKVRLGQNQDKILARIAAACNGVPGVAIQMLEMLVTTIRGGGKVADALQFAVQNNPGKEGFDSALAYVKAIVARDEMRAVRAIADCGSPDGVIEMANQMLVALIRVSSGGTPTSGLGWVVKKNVSVGPKDLPHLLLLQSKFVAALDINSRRIVPAESILFGLCRQ